MAFQEGFNPFGGINKSSSSGGDSGGGAGGGVMYVTVDIDVINEAFIADKTYSEIETAYNNGAIIVAKTFEVGDEVLYPLTRITDESFIFSMTSIVSEDLNQFVSQTTYLINSDNTVRNKTNQYPSEPIVV